LDEFAFEGFGPYWDWACCGWDTLPRAGTSTALGWPSNGAAPNRLSRSTKP